MMIVFDTHVVVLMNSYGLSVFLLEFSLHTVAADLLCKLLTNVEFYPHICI